MMCVYLNIAFARQCQVRHRMLRKERQHVVEERHSGVYARRSLAINRETEANLGFFRDALYLRPANLHVSVLEWPHTQSAKAILAGTTE
jgi:hypothetical protein